MVVFVLFYKHQHIIVTFVFLGSSYRAFFIFDNQTETTISK